MRRTVVILAAGASLTIAGCRAGREDRVTNPPPVEPTQTTQTPEAADLTRPAPGSIVPEVPSPEGEQIQTANPPPPTLPAVLPAWEDAVSGHPEGATNPPVPVLAINPDGSECFKEWYDPRTVPEQARAIGGRILAEGESSEGTQVQCPRERVDTLLGQ